jgi:hypothetical protein
MGPKNAQVQAIVLAKAVEIQLMLPPVLPSVSPYIIAYAKLVMA